MLQLPSLYTCPTLRSPDRQQVVAGTDEGLIYLLHTSTLAAQLISQSHSAAITALGYAPQASDRFATAAGDGALRVWDASNYCAVVSATVKGAHEPLCLELTQDLLVSGWRDGIIRAHDADSGALLWQIDDAHSGGVTALTLSGNQRTAATAVLMLTSVYAATQAMLSLLLLLMATYTSTSVFVCATACAFASCVCCTHSVSRDRSIICWDLRTEKQVSHHSQRMGGVNGVALSRDQAT
eukprot:10142-Heterococcus_DN1.PRE.1